MRRGLLRGSHGAIVSASDTHTHIHTHAKRSNSSVEEGWLSPLRLLYLSVDNQLTEKIVTPSFNSNRFDGKMTCKL